MVLWFAYALLKISASSHFGLRDALDPKELLDTGGSERENEVFEFVEPEESV